MRTEESGVWGHEKTSQRASNKAVGPQARVNHLCFLMVSWFQPEPCGTKPTPMTCLEWLSRPSSKSGPTSLPSVTRRTELVVAERRLAEVEPTGVHFRPQGQALFCVFSRL